jgi:hypothetical protein
MILFLIRHGRIEVTSQCVLPENTTPSTGLDIVK